MLHVTYVRTNCNIFVIKIQVKKLSVVVGDTELAAAFFNALKDVTF